MFLQLGSPTNFSVTAFAEEYLKFITDFFRMLSDNFLSISRTEVGRRLFTIVLTINMAPVFMKNNLNGSPVEFLRFVWDTSNQKPTFNRILPCICAGSGDPNQLCWCFSVISNFLQQLSPLHFSRGMYKRRGWPNSGSVENYQNQFLRNRPHHGFFNMQQIFILPNSI